MVPSSDDERESSPEHLNHRADDDNPCEMGSIVSGEWTDVGEEIQESVDQDEEGAVDDSYTVDEYGRDHFRQIICTTVDKINPHPRMAAYVFSPSPVHEPRSPLLSFSPVFSSPSPTPDLSIPAISLSPEQSHDSPVTTPEDNQSMKCTARSNSLDPFDNVPHVRPFAIERHSPFVTPRSPGRQARLEQMETRRILRNHFAEMSSRSEEPIYLPQLKTGTPQETSKLGSKESSQKNNTDSEVLHERDEEVRVWDARILHSDGWIVYLTRDR